MKFFECILLFLLLRNELWLLFRYLLLLLYIPLDVLCCWCSSIHCNRKRTRCDDILGQIGTRFVFVFGDQRFVSASFNCIMHWPRSFVFIHIIFFGLLMLILWPNMTFLLMGEKSNANLVAITHFCAGSQQFFRHDFDKNFDRKPKLAGLLRLHNN